MTARRDLDNLVRAYLDEGPIELPNRSFDAVRNHIDHTHQRVVVGPWRMPIMNKLVPIGVGAAAVVAAVVVIGANFLLPNVNRPGVGSQPTTSPAALPRPSPRAGEQTFSSTLNGISIDYPAGWETRPATEAWNHDAINFDALDVDVIFDPTLREDLYFALVSEPLGGKSGPEWVGGFSLSSVGICTGTFAGGSGSISVVDGADGYGGTCGSPAAGGHWATIATGTRGYLIYLHVRDEPLLQATYDLAWFEAALETVDLRRDEAVDASNRSPTR